MNCKVCGGPILPRGADGRLTGAVHEELPCEIKHLKAERDTLLSKLHQLSEDHSHCEGLLHELGDRASRAESRLSSALNLAGAQAEDDGLWFQAATAPEAYLQQELRKLHAAIEGGVVEKLTRIENANERLGPDWKPLPDDATVCPTCGADLLYPNQSE